MYSPDQRKLSPWHALQTFQVDVAGLEILDVGLREIIAHDADELRIREKARAHGAYEAEPPSRSACSSTGVLTVSSAMEPAMRTGISGELNQ